MSLFDPFGVAAEYSLMAKLLLQAIWRMQVDWDDTIPEDAFKIWSKWLRMLEDVKQISIPRCYSAVFTAVLSELHIFVLGKTNCAPLKLLSVPRLELQSAVLGTRVRQLILRSHNVTPSRVVMWCDSRPVLAWVKSDHRRYKPYVAHRINEILDSTMITDWRWLPSALNTADFGTRIKDNKRKSFWIEAPTFLKKRDCEWPRMVEDIESTDEEIRSKFVSLHINSTCDIFERFSCFSKLKSVVAWILRFHNNCKMRLKKTRGVLKVAELEKAEKVIALCAQMEVYGEEYRVLKAGMPIDRTSHLLKLTPQIDEDGLLRVNGRINTADAVVFDTRCPIILPKYHRLTKLICEFYHRKWKHQNKETIIAEIRKKYWIPHIRTAVNRAAKNCQFCKIRYAKPEPPLMGQLPKDRLTSFPTRLVSPSSLFRIRRGNSFEMATLLVSILVGAGYPAMVVSGVAREATIFNDQRNVEYPHKIEEPTIEEEVEEKPKTGKKYKLRPMPDLESHLEENMAAMMKQKEEEEQRVREEAERLEKEELELRAADKYHFHRCHAWVVIIENAPWSICPPKMYVNEDGETVEEPPKPRFIEPSTGFECDTKSKQYILVDSIWNQFNYYVNLQKYQRISEIRWDLRVVTDWEHLLPGEPPEMRQYKMTSDENIEEDKRDIEEEKHLDTIRCWVAKPFIGLRMFEQRYPKNKKTIYYKRAIHIRYSPYTQRDGRKMQLTLYADDEYTVPVTRWEFFGCRVDNLKLIKFTYETNQKQESFNKGRNDNLKFMDYNMDPNKPRYLYFYSSARLDSLKYMEVHRDRILLMYSKRSDMCFHQEFEMKASAQTLKKITEKFNRNLTDDIPAYKDIAVRTFILNQRKIILKFHYARGALTSSTIEFTKPPKPDYGHEIKYEPNLTKMYKANMSDPDPTPLELYKLLLAQLQYEEKVKKQFERIVDEINCILDLRKQEMMYPVLSFSLFDPIRNGCARTLRLQQDADEEAFKKEMATKPADYLSPYLVPYKRQLTYEESWAAYNACLFDLKTRFVGLLNDLQRQYEDLTTESKSLKRFLKKFENQFNNFDFERLVKEAKDIELNKRMVQQALEQTHEESQKKYEFVKESLMNDPRLNLKRQQSIN